MQVETAILGRIENGLRQDQAIGDNDSSMGIMRAKFGLGFWRFERGWSQYAEVKPPCFLLHWSWLEFQSPSGRLRSTGVNRYDLVAMFMKRAHRRHREFRRAHEDQVEGHVAAVC